MLLLFESFENKMPKTNPILSEDKISFKKTEIEELCIIPDFDEPSFLLVTPQEVKYINGILNCIDMCDS